MGRLGDATRGILRLSRSPPWSSLCHHRRCAPSSSSRLSWTSSPASSSSLTLLQSRSIHHRRSPVVFAVNDGRHGLDCSKVPVHTDNNGSYESSRTFGAISLPVNRPLGQPGSHPEGSKRPFHSGVSNPREQQEQSSESGDMGNKEREVVVEHLTNPDVPDAVVTVVTLNRPKANAMGSVMLQQLQEAIAPFERGKEGDDDDDGHKSDDAFRRTRCVVITSFSDRVFSAGADLKERKEMSQEQAEEFVSSLRDTMERVSNIPVPVLVAVEGVALGGGFELALACDIRVVSESSRFGLPETSLAIVPGAGGTQRLPRLIGPARAQELIYTASSNITSRLAMEYGIAQREVPPGRATSEATELAWKIARNGPVAIRSAKEAIKRGMAANDMTEALRIERECYNRVLPTQDRLEGLQAFQEGRKPQYKGR